MECSYQVLGDWYASQVLTLDVIHYSFEEIFELYNVIKLQRSVLLHAKLNSKKDINLESWRIIIYNLSKSN